MMLGAHRYRWFYFLGRLCSYGLAGMAAGGAGAVLNLLFNYYHLSAAISFLFAGMVIAAGIAAWGGKTLPLPAPFVQVLGRFSSRMSLLLLRDQPLATFLFGFLTVALPCGQTLIAFAACAVAGSAWEGLINGVAFALLTSPSLFFAMHCHRLLGTAKKHYNAVMGSSAFVAGGFALCRALAEIGWIDHLALPLGKTLLLLY
jgi:hypothetical protein